MARAGITEVLTTVQIVTMKAENRGWQRYERQIQAELRREPRVSRKRGNPAGNRDHVLWLIRINR
ncbi:hypothetical protein [Amycolatopsis acididurans]|uniref:hypothetical protein n=1 Tax=Amycolatopsis acididurans TaxID=2724524 RepID=UPI0028B14E76|nr:hypothetical protein [Amycolatopsis acididurans]